VEPCRLRVGQSTCNYQSSSPFQTFEQITGRRLFIIAIVVATGTILAPGRPTPFLHELGGACATLGLVLDVPKSGVWLADSPELKILNIQ